MDADRGLDLAQSAIAACVQNKIPATLTGSLALLARGILVRAVSDVNLSTPHPFHPRVAYEMISAMLRREHMQVETYTPRSRAHVEVVARAESDTAPIRLTLTHMHSYEGAEELKGLRVAKVGDCLNRTVQALRGRFEEKDYLDLVALERKLGQGHFDSLLATFLANEAKEIRRVPVHIPQLEYYYRLSHARRMSPRNFDALKPSEWSMSQVIDRVRRMLEVQGRILRDTPEHLLMKAQKSVRAPLAEDPVKLADLRAVFVVAQLDHHFAGPEVPEPATRLAAYAAGLSNEELEAYIQHIDATLALRPVRGEPVRKPPTYYDQPPPSPSMYPPGISHG